MTAADTHRAVLAVWRSEHQRLIAILARMLRDVPLAEEFAQEALLAALETWPGGGVPDQPAAWLVTTAKRRALDYIRRSLDHEPDPTLLEQIMALSPAERDALANELIRRAGGVVPHG